MENQEYTNGCGQINDMNGMGGMSPSIPQDSNITQYNPIIHNMDNLGNYMANLSTGTDSSSLTMMEKYL